MKTFPTREVTQFHPVPIFSMTALEMICVQFPQSVIYHLVDDILLADSNVDTLEKMFEEVKKILPCWGLQIVPEKHIKRRFYY